MNNYFTKQEKIRFKHVDYAGIVFYPRFLEMLNDLVEDWFEEALDRPFSKIHETNGIPTVDLKVQFKKARIENNASIINMLETDFFLFCKVVVHLYYFLALIVVEILFCLY